MRPSTVVRGPSAPQASRFLRLQTAVPRLTLPQVWLALAIVLPGLTALLAPLSTVDLAYQLRAGSGILDGQGIPRADSWTFTIPGTPWLDQQWGAQMALAWVWRAFGWTGLVVLRSLLIGAAWACLVVAIRRTNRTLDPRLVAILALVAFVVTVPALALRPQLFAIAAFCLVLALLAGRHEHRIAVWLVPIVVAAWANVHGSFVLGPLLVGLAWLADLASEPGRQANAPAAGANASAAAPRPLALRTLAPRTLAPRTLAPRTLALAAVTGAAMLVTPFGFDALRYALTLSTNRELAARVTEWQPPSPTEATGLLFFASVVAVVAIVVWRGRHGRRLGPVALLTLALFAGLALVAARGVAWWPAIAVVTIAPLPGRAPGPERPSASDVPAGTHPPTRPRASAANTALVVVLLLAAIPLLPAWRGTDPELGLGAPRGLLGQAPSGLTAALRSVAGSNDRLWAPQTWGSWFELAIPTVPVAVDSRIELFGADLWADYDTVAAAASGWPAILDRRGATIVAVAVSQNALRNALRDAPGWRETAAIPGEGSLFVRAERRVLASR